MADRQQAVDRLLEELKSGNREAFSQLLPLVYEELHNIASRQRGQWDGEDTLNTTALIHEAYLRLADQSAPEWQSYPHFLAVAATAMRQILIDYAKRKRAAKRGGSSQRVRIDELESLLANPDQRDEARAGALIELNNSLRRLAEIDPRQCRVVECRFFGNMTIQDTAAALGIAPATVGRDWMMAKAWLYRDLRKRLEEDHS